MQSAGDSLAAASLTAFATDEDLVLVGDALPFALNAWLHEAQKTEDQAFYLQQLDLLAQTYSIVQRLSKYGNLDLVHKSWTRSKYTAIKTDVSFVLFNSLCMELLLLVTKLRFYLLQS